MATGVASPSAQGQLMTSTEMPRDSRYKHTGNLVCDLGNGSLGGSGIADHANDLGKRSIFSHTCGFTPEKTGLVDRGS